jgi:tetratricopeptide (TPR) repeat protein
MRLKKFGRWLYLGVFFVGTVNAQPQSVEAEAHPTGWAAGVYIIKPSQPVEAEIQLAGAGVRQEAPDPVAESVRQPADTDVKKAVELELLRRLVYNADILIKSKKAAEAYALLEPHEDTYSGEISFDYLLGIAALDSGKPDRATIAFERVLTVNPNFSGARIDLARAYFAMGSDDLAKNEFATVLLQNPPEPTAVVIKKYIELIDERQQAKIQKVTSYLETSVGYDDNITAATSTYEQGIAEYMGMSVLVLRQNYGTLTPGASSLHYARMFEGVSGGLDFTRLVNEENGVSLLAGADVKHRVYDRVNAMNNTNLDLRVGVAVANGADNYKVTGTFGHYWQAGFTSGTTSNRETLGLGTEWKHSIGERDQITWSLNFSQPRYLSHPSPSTQDTKQLALSGSWLHIFEGTTTPLIFANANRSVDRAVRLNDNGSNMGRTTTGVLAHFQFTPLPNMDFFMSGGLTVRHDGSPNARTAIPYDFYAHDLTKTLTAGVTARPLEKWTIKGTVSATDNNSNVSLFKYRKLESSVSLRRDF